jgi:hypothetical protein
VPIQRRVGLPVDASWENCPFGQSGVLSNVVSSMGYPVKGGTFQIQTVAAKLGTNPTTGSVVMNVKKNGTTIYSTGGNKPTVGSGATNGIATVGAHDATTVTDGDWISVDIEGTYTGSPANMVCVVRMQRIS